MENSIGWVQFYIVIARGENTVLYRTGPRRVTAGRLAKGAVRSCKQHTAEQRIAPGGIGTGGA